MTKSVQMARERLAVVVAIDHAKRAAVRGEGEATTLSSDREGMAQIFRDPFNTVAGAVVNESTAMRVSAVYACTRLISGAIAGLPIPVYQRGVEGRQRVEHDYWWMLNEQPCATWSASAWREFAQLQVLLRGDAIAYLLRNRAGVVTAIVPWARSKVRWELVKQSARDPGRLKYYFQSEEGTFGADQDDVLHFPGFGFNGVHSMSVIQWGARNGIGIAIKGDDMAGNFFSSGGKPEIAITSAKSMTPKMQGEFLHAWNEKYRDYSDNRIPLILTEGLDVKELTMSAVDAQLIETRKWQVIDIARAFGVPPFLIGETEKQTSFGSGVESLGIGFVKYTLKPHITRVDHELNRKLFRTSRHFVEHNVDGFLEGDAKAQAEYFAKALGGPGSQGYMAVDEVRRIKNLPPMGGEFSKVMKAGGAPAEEPKPPEADDPTDKDNKPQEGDDDAQE